MNRSLLRELTRTLRRVRFARALPVLAVLSACTGGESENGSTAQSPRAAANVAAMDVVAVPPTPAARTFLAQGNAALEAGDAHGARGHFRAATAESPGFSAAWFGVYLAELAAGDSTEAAVALERSRVLSENR